MLAIVSEQAELQRRTSAPRYLELDGLRGVAAFTVIWHHFCAMYSVPLAWYRLPFTAGSQAVLLFFLLSGFVLSLHFWDKGENGPYKPYLVRRFFRLYVPLAAAIVLAAIADLYLGHGRLPLSSWYYHTWQKPVTARLVLQSLLLDPTAELNTAIWSLRYEIQISILFPFLLLSLRWLRRPLSFSLAAASFAVATVGQIRGWQDSHHLISLMEYGPIFIFGALLAQSRADIGKGWARTPEWARIAILLLSCALFWGYGQGNVVQRFHVSREALHGLTILGAAGLVVCAQHQASFRSMLRSLVPAYLGRISYSLYLVHGTVLFGLVNLLYLHLSRGAMGFVYLVSSMVVAHLFCIGIEEPSLRFGKRLAMSRVG